MLLLLAIICCSSVDASWIVTTNAGKVSGSVLSDKSSSPVAIGFLGIPFAEQPIRFQPPTPKAPWSGVKVTQSFGDGCPQICVLPSGLCPLSQSEDCLNLNVFVPYSSSLNGGSLLPVMVFFAGGGFIQGAAGTQLYDARYLVNTTNVIVVSINYRLGVLGFLVNNETTGNYGMMDQRLGLHWVQNNIKAFGGDPSQVTLFGQSAGGISTAYHLAAKESRGLFQRAIVQSDPLALPMFSRTTGEIFTSVVADKIGCDPDDTACFRNCTGDCLQTMLIAQNKGAGLHILHPFTAFLPTLPLYGPNSDLHQNLFEILASGDVAPVPVIFSACTNDATMFIAEAFPDGVSYLDYVGFLTDLWGVQRVPEITERYPSFVSTQQRTANLARLATDYLFICPARFISRTLGARPNLKSHMFIFNHIWSFSGAGWGSHYAFCDDQVCHGEELPFEFGSALFNYTLAQNEVPLMTDIMRAVSNFAKSGDPNQPLALQQFWPDVSKNTTYVFDTPSHVDQGYDNSNCDFWDSLSYQFGGNMFQWLAKRAVQKKK